MPEWETLITQGETVTWRLRVPGGWIYLINQPSAGAVISTCCFVPLTGNQTEDQINDATI